MLSRELAESLFGSTKVTGEQIRLNEPAWITEETSKSGGDRSSSAGGELFEVAGVADQEGNYLLIPMLEGTAETVAVLFEKRFQSKERGNSILEFRR